MNRLTKVLVFLLCLVACTTAPVKQAETPAPIPSPSMTPVTPRIVGLTIDNPYATAEIVAALKGLPVKPWVRIVFDENVSASQYKATVKAIQPYAQIMGEILDSYYVKNCDVRCYQDRTKDYVTTLPEVDVWEVANEINGDWLGKNAWLKASAALGLVKSAGKRAAVTYYLEEDLGMFQWIEKNVSPEQRAQIDWAMVSYYEKDNDDWAPNWQAVIERLGQAHPTSSLLIGEMGDDRSQAKAKVSFHKYYTGMTVSHPRYLFGGFDWYQAQFIGKSSFLYEDFKNALR